MDILYVERKDGKIFEISKRNDGYYIIENRGLDGRFEATLNNGLWSRVMPFPSKIQAYGWLKKNAELLL